MCQVMGDGTAYRCVRALRAFEPLARGHGFRRKPWFTFFASTGIGLKNVNATNFMTPLVLTRPAQYPLRERSPLL